MTNSQLALLKTLSLTDMAAIQDALEAQSRATEKFLRQHIEPNKEGYPTLFESYTRQVTEETNRFHKFKAILEQLY